MEPVTFESQPKSIKTVGLVVTVLSAFIIFGNGMGALAFSLMGNGQTDSPPLVHADPMTLVLSYYVQLCLTMVGIGLIYLIGGVYLRRYKLWANRLVSVISILLIILIWCTMIVLAIEAQKTDIEMAGVIAIFTGAFWTIPLVLLVRFLNRQEIKKHFV